MAAYNGVNGPTMTENPLLRDVLKQEWGFDGVVMSDWFAARSLAAAGAGLLDLVMPGPSGPWGEDLVTAVRAGDVPESAVDDKVLRILRLAARVGALADLPPVEAEPWSPAQVAAELRGAAAGGFVLARNSPVAATAEPLLPLSPRAGGRIVVLGPNAALARSQGGGSATVFPAYSVSPLEGIRRALGPDVHVEYARGGRSTTRLPVAAVESLRRPDGHPGTEVRFLGTDGAVLATEVRDGASFTWQSSYGHGLVMTDVAAIEVHTRLRARRSGTHLIGGSGLGSFRVTVDGVVVAEDRRSLPEGADPVEAMMRPPQLAAPIHLDVDREVDLVLHHEPADVSGFGDPDSANVVVQLNVDMAVDDRAELDAAVDVARSADVAVVVVGTTEEVESEGFDRTFLALPGLQDELVRRVVAANPRTVVVVNAGAPVLLPWAADVPAVLLTWFPGQEFGNALADVLLGSTEPGGRLPVSWPSGDAGLPSTRPVDGQLAYDEDLFIGHRWYDREDRKPLYRFGHGLGFTTWEYLSADSEGAGDAGTAVTVRVRNTGARRGREVVQIYAGRPDSCIDRPRRWLAGFAVVDAEPGGVETATVTVPARAFQHWDVMTQRWTVEPGTFRLFVGSSSGDLPLALDVDVQGP